MHGKQAVTSFALGILIFFPFSSAQAEPISRDEEIEKTFSRMEADIDSIAEAAQESLNEEDAVKPAPAKNIIISPSSHSQLSSEKNISVNKIQQKAAVEAAPVSGSRSSREQTIDITLRNIAIEISLEYFINMGNQTFNAMYPDGGDMSRLDFPLEGNMPVIKGEIRFLPRLSLGGRYSDSSLKEGICSDEDWDFWGIRDIGAGPQLKYIDYQITKQGSKSRVEFYDINLYYNLFNSGRENPDQRTIFPVNDPVYENLLIDRMSLDILAGYQYYKGRNRMVDPDYELMDLIEGSWYYDPALPGYSGLDSFYKIKYWGPRIGLRASGSKGKVTSQIKLAYAILRTKAYGWWNLREYSFWHSGSKGYGVEFGIETAYAFTPAFSVGIGFDYLGYFQKKMKASGIQPGYVYEDEDIIRDANSRNYGPTFTLKYIW